VGAGAVAGLMANRVAAARDEGVARAGEGQAP